MSSPILNKTGKILAKPLSHVVANSVTEGVAQWAEAYWCILLGKGSGTSWALDAEIGAAKSIIRHPSPIIFDVGANVGEYSFLLHQLYPEAQIFLFEPQPACQRIISERNIPGSILIPNAVASTAGQTIKLFTRGETDVLASLHKRRDSYFRDKTFSSVDVNTVTIDDTIREYEISGIDFMKMDVEGNELDALKGSMKSLESGIIKALSFEFGSSNVNSRTFFHDFWDLLTPLGYEIYRILPSSRLMPIKRYSEGCEHFRGVTNYIAVLP